MVDLNVIHPYFFVCQIFYTIIINKLIVHRYKLYIQDTIVLTEQYIFVVLTMYQTNQMLHNYSNLPFIPHDHVTPIH